MNIKANLVFFFILGIFLFSNRSFAQFELNYEPYQISVKENKKMVGYFENSFKSKIWSTSDSKTWLHKYYRTKSADLIIQAKKGLFFPFDHKDSLIDTIIWKIKAHNDLTKFLRNIIIARNPEVNATCLGEGTILVNNGLLAKVRTEEELAFIICHELAHLELDHVDILLEISHNSQKSLKTRKEINKILRGKSSLEGIENLQSWAYGTARFNRVMELHADSLGMKIFKNAYPNSTAPLTALHMLDSAELPWYQTQGNFFKYLDSEKFPIDHNLANRSLKLYKTEPSKFLFFDVDSIKTHPNIKERISTTGQKLEVDLDEVNEHAVDKNFTLQYRFETINSSIASGKYDWALYSALQLKTEFPNNSFLNEKIAQILLDIFRLKRDNKLKYMVSRYTIHYSDELRMLNNFIFTTSSIELINMAYHYLNSKGNFNKEDQEHYYLLWQIAQESGRTKLEENVKKAYYEKHKGGKYSIAMKLPLW